MNGNDLKPGDWILVHSSIGNVPAKVKSTYSMKIGHSKKWAIVILVNGEELDIHVSRIAACDPLLLQIIKANEPNSYR